MGLTNSNYVMQPYKLVKDVRTGYETSDVDGVMNGDIDSLKAYLMMMGQRGGSSYSGKRQFHYLNCHFDE
jgi:hypothetical protein